MLAVAGVCRRPSPSVARFFLFSSDRGGNAPMYVRRSYSTRRRFLPRAAGRAQGARFGRVGYRQFGFARRPIRSGYRPGYQFRPASGYGGAASPMVFPMVGHPQPPGSGPFPDPPLDRFVGYPAELGSPDSVGVRGGVHSGSAVDSAAAQLPVDNKVPIPGGQTDHGVVGSGATASWDQQRQVDRAYRIQWYRSQHNQLLDQLLDCHADRLGRSERSPVRRDTPPVLPGHVVPPTPTPTPEPESKSS